MTTEIKEITPEVEGVADTIQILTKESGYEQYFFFGMKEDKKWIMTCSVGFSRDHMASLRDYFNRQLADA